MKLVNPERLKLAACYNECFKPNGLNDLIILPTVADDIATGLPILGGGEDGFFADEARKMTDAIAPHLYRASVISIALKRTRTALREGLFASTKQAAIWVTGKLDLIEQNAAAQEQIFDCGIASLHSGRVQFSDLELSNHIKKGVAQTALYGPSGVNASEPNPIKVDNEYKLSITPVDSDLSPVFQNLKATTFLLTFHPIDAAVALKSKLIEQFSLTQAEAEISALFAEGASLKDIADLRQTKLTTTRWHLKQIFQKLGVSSQRGLMSKLSRLR